MAHVFISYARENRKAAQDLAWHLEQRRWSVWWDRGLLGGDEYTTVITQELSVARAVVVLWSQESITSRWVVDEAARAEKRLVPVLIERVRPPLGYGSIHTFDLSGWNGAPDDDEFTLLLHTLNTLITTGRNDSAYLTSQSPVNVPVLASSSDRKALAVIGVIAGLVVLGLLVGVLARKPTPPPPEMQAARSEVSSSDPPRAPTATADMTGAWDSQKANSLVSGKVAAAAWRELLSTRTTVTVCNPKHSTVGEYSLLYPTRESKIVVTASMCEGADCHACAPDLSIFEFDKVDAGWNLVHSDLAVTSWGQWGEGDKNVQVRVIGNNRFGLVLEGSGMGAGGEMASTVNIFARISDSYREILSLTTSDETRANPNIPLTDWKAELEVQERGNTGFFNIKVTRKGISDGKPINETELWVFDGQKYGKAGEYQ